MRLRLRQRWARDNGYRRDVPLPLLTRDEMYALIVEMRMRRANEQMELVRANWHEAYRKVSGA